MIKAIFTAFTGVEDSMDSPEVEAQWERQKYIDENDLDDDDVNDLNNSQADDDDSSDRKGWFSLQTALSDLRVKLNGLN